MMMIIVNCVCVLLCLQQQTFIPSNGLFFSLTLNQNQLCAQAQRVIVATNNYLYDQIVYKITNTFLLVFIFYLHYI